MLKIQGLKKKFGNFEALSGLDMKVEEGALYGFVGPNGAGKTTAIRLTIRSQIVSTRTTMKNRMLITITIRRKLVPQRLCSLELFLTFSTLSTRPCSKQLMHLCSDPWYMNVRLMSSIREITLM